MRDPLIIWQLQICIVVCIVFIDGLEYHAAF